MNEERKKSHIEEFERLGEAKVRASVELLTWKSHDPGKHNTAKEWLIHQSVRSDEESRSNSLKALAIARRSNKIAISAIILSVITAISIAIIDSKSSKNTINKSQHNAQQAVLDSQ